MPGKREPELSLFCSRAGTGDPDSPRPTATTTTADFAASALLERAGRFAEAAANFIQNAASIRMLENLDLIVAERVPEKGIVRGD